MAPNGMNSRTSKIYDIVIFGGSGFTGKYVVREALKFLNTPNSPLKSLALAGRSPSRLSEALRWACGSDPPPGIPLLAADTSDPNSIIRLATQAKIILNCVGPFQLYGEPVVSACVDSGCEYLDICGKPEFMERMEALYHDKAVENGSLVISACAFVSVMAEIGLLFHSRHWAGHLVLNRVEAYWTLESDKKVAANFGTYKSLVLWLANADKLSEFQMSRPKRARPEIPGPPRRGSIFQYQKELGLWAIEPPSADPMVVQKMLSILSENPLGLPGVNESVDNVTKRVAFWSYAKPAHFGTNCCSKSLLHLFRVIVCGLFAMLLSKLSLGRWLLLKLPSFFSLGLFRKNGPSKDEVESAVFKMWFVGQGFSEIGLASRGKMKPDTEVITSVMGPEIGYITTPIILLQCALILLNDRHNLPKGGVYTPGIVFGPTELEQRLQEKGIAFDFISKRDLSS